MELTRDEKEIVFIRVPSHVDIRGNSADSAAKDACDDDISDELIPYSAFKSCVNKYVSKLSQSTPSGTSSLKINCIKYFKVKGLHYLSLNKQKRPC